MGFRRLDLKDPARAPLDRSVNSESLEPACHARVLRCSGQLIQTRDLISSNGVQHGGSRYLIPM